jgi:hypothetical protein
VDKDVMDEELSQFKDNENTLVCIGKFDAAGFPIVTSRHLGSLATATLQALGLAALLSQTIQPEPLQGILMRLDDGSIVRIEPNDNGYIAYLQMPTTSG